MGTMCYVMGGGEIRSLVETLPAEMKDRLEVTYSPCLGYCDKAGNPPYVELNGQAVQGVTAGELLQMLKEELKDAVR